MNHRKFKADQIFTGYQMLGADHVLITDAAGKIISVEKEIDAGSEAEYFKGIITPGFINAHCHLELSHMKGLVPEKTGLVDFVFKVVTERHFPDEEIFAAIEKAEEEMLQNGIVAVGDICNNLSTLPQKLKANIVYYNFIETSGWLPSIAQARFERALNLYKEFQLQTTKYKPQTSIVPHAPYSVSQNLWEFIIPYFKNKTISIHNQETPFEDEFFLQGTGDFLRMYEKMNIDNSFHVPTNKSSLESYFSKLSNAKNVMLVHNTFTKQEDLEFIKLQTINQQLQTFFCLCVNANQYIENALPPLELFIKNNCDIILGTDSLASNHSLNILDEMKTIQKNFSSVLLPQMLQWCTLNGAKALQIDDKFGSFEKDKTPGIVLIEKVDNGNISAAKSRRIL